MIEVQRLSKTYGEFTAVDDISLVAEAGRVTGFLGPNGAGKTTTMRILAGLTRPGRGTATIGGRAFADIPNPARHVGVLLDASAQHPGRTGREVLTLAARVIGLPAARVDEMLERVALTPAESRRTVRNYSLGMRQRLGVAHALIGDPQVLILDEPANGLDPAGIRAMRTLLRDYADRGGTVLLSSHLLHEVEQIADEIVMIGRGRIVAEGTTAELLAGAGTRVHSTDDQALAAAARAAGHTATLHDPGTPGLTIDAEPAEVGRLALVAGVALVDLGRSRTGGLEDLFLELTADTQRDRVDLVDTHGSTGATTEGIPA